MLNICALALATLLSSTCGELCDPEIVRAYARLNAAAAMGRYASEWAGFVVRKPNGRVDVILWPSGEDLKATYKGPMPQGCVAVMHTHPARAPRPSRQDLAEASRIGLPIVVITPEAVTVARPDATAEELLGKGWRRSLRRK